MTVSTVRYAIPAIEDISEIAAYISKDNPAMADSFIGRLKEKCRSIAEAPHMGRQREDYGEGVRSFPFGSYVIFYRPAASGIVVARVLHGARNLQKAFQAER